MTKQPHPHRLRRSGIKALFLLIALAAALAVWLTGCSPKGGCPAIHKNKFRGNARLHCNETGKTVYFNKEGKLMHICKK
jgi:hypothetical protein